MRILFVCLGNICRSPLAEAIFVHKARSRGLDHFEVDSCGTSNYNLGYGHDPRTLRNAIKNGVTVEHVARQLTPRDLSGFDRVLVMDKSNLRATLGVADQRDHHKIMLIRAFDPNGEGEVPDPYYGGEEDFQEVFEMLDRCVEGLLSDLEKEISG
jgi:protein-tyrosine phosphatase